MTSAGSNPSKKCVGGRPANGKGIQIGERWPPGVIEQIDDWRHQQSDIPGWPEAIRHLIEPAKSEEQQMKYMALVEQLEFSHWLIIAGVALVLLGVIGMIASRTGR